ncbi:imm11 family protein [Sphingobium yanoikuyae]|uniref:imm11 family protein n=1 Tax=Sphingobium yanoikuyae TaxID=13690 RepID=UPI0022DD4EE1|nr:DUF1629 domain-containing protein [Sphingobium yanoikuyae]WBQ17643.1 hypothetical protein PAE53_05395 [Sphingobium yanoikuyae]
MAWVLRHSVGEQYAPIIQWSEATTRWIEEAQEAVRQTLGDHPPGDALSMRTSVPGSKGVPAGLSLPNPSGPMRATMLRGSSELPDRLPFEIVSNAIRNLVEELEPATHQFFPVILTLPDGQEVGDLWYMRACHRLDSVSIENSRNIQEWRPSPRLYPGWVSYRATWSSSTKIAVKSDIIAGKSLWYDWRFKQMFASEAFGKAIIDLGITGYPLPSDEIGCSIHAEEI